MQQILRSNLYQQRHNYIDPKSNKFWDADSESGVQIEIKYTVFAQFAILPRKLHFCGFCDIKY